MTLSTLDPSEVDAVAWIVAVLKGLPLARRMDVMAVACKVFVETDGSLGERTGFYSERGGGHS